MRTELNALKATHSADQHAVDGDLDDLEAAFASADTALQHSVSAVSKMAGPPGAPLQHMRSGFYNIGKLYRPHVESQTNTAYVDYTQCFDRAGTIESIRFYSGRANQAGHRFQLYRRVGQHQYKVVRETAEISTPFQDGVQTFVPAGGMEVQPGDCVGWQHSGMGTVKYCQTGDRITTGRYEHHPHYRCENHGATKVLWRHGLVNDQETADFTQVATRRYAYTIDWQPTKMSTSDK